MDASNGSNGSNGSKNTFTNVAGQTFRVRPVVDTLVTLALARIETAYRERGEPLDVPTYTITLTMPDGTAGGTEVIALDAEALEVPGDPAQTTRNQAAWAAHQSAVQRLESEQQAKRVYLWLMGGIACEAEAAAAAWAEEQTALFGVEIPMDPLERRWHYLNTVAVPTADDLATAIGAVTGISLRGLMASEEVDALVESFRDQLSEGAAERMRAAGVGVAAQPEAARDRDGEKLGPDAQPVSRSKRKRHSRDAGA